MSVRLGVHTRTKQSQSHVLLDICLTTVVPKVARFLTDLLSYLTEVDSLEQPAVLSIVCIGTAALHAALVDAALVLWGLKTPALHNTVLIHLPKVSSSVQGEEQ